jgi:hypothetical protein
MSMVEARSVIDLGNGFYRLCCATASWRRPTCPPR